MTARIAVHGAAGRMGREVVAAVRAHDEATLVAAVDQAGADVIGKDAGLLSGGGTTGVEVTADLASAAAKADVVIDFSLASATPAVADACKRHEVPTVVGTTGFDEQGEAALETLASAVPVVVAPNFSQGVTLLFHLAARAAELLGPGFDAEIVEMHHRRKVDAPSGTAARLGDVVARAKGLEPADSVVHGRSGHVGARPDAQVGVMALRGGDVVGEHTLVLAGEGERVELGHRAGDRGIFARGAVRAALWAVRQRPGRYDMADVMGIPR